MNRLPKVKKWINEVLPLYDDSQVSIKYIGGADPEMVFLAADDTEVERVSVIELDEDEIDKLLQERGFSKKEDTFQENDEL